MGRLCETADGLASDGQKWSRGFEPLRDEGHSQAKDELFGNGIPGRPTAVTQSLEYGVCRRLRKAELASDVGKAVPATFRPAEQLNDIEDTLGRR